MVALSTWLAVVETFVKTLPSLVRTTYVLASLLPAYEVRGKVMFSLCLSTRGEGVLCSLVSGPSWGRGYPSLWSQVPSGGRGYPCPGPCWAGGGGTLVRTSTLLPLPQPRPGQGYTPTPIPRDNMLGTRYAAGGTPLTVTQEDFLVLIINLKLNQDFFITIRQGNLKTLCIVTLFLGKVKILKVSAYN